MFLFYSFLGNIKVFFCYLVSYKVSFFLNTSNRSSSTSHTIIKYQFSLIRECTDKPPHKIHGLLCRVVIVSIVFLIHSDYACWVLFIGNPYFSNSKVAITSVLCTTYPISSSSCEGISSFFFFLPPFVIFPYTPPDLLWLYHSLPPRLWFTCPNVN